MNAAVDRLRRAGARTDTMYWTGVSGTCYGLMLRTFLDAGDAGQPVDRQRVSELAAAVRRAEEIWVACGGAP